MRKKIMTEVELAEAQMVELLWLVSLSRWTRQSKAASLVDEQEDVVAVVASNHSIGPTAPLRQRFKSSGVDIKGRSGWLIDRIVQEIRPGRKAIRQLHLQLNEALPGYARQNWLDNHGKVSPAMKERGVIDHIKVDLAMMCGFSLWIERHAPDAHDHQIDLSSIPGTEKEDRHKVRISNFQFPAQERLDLIHGLPTKVKKSLQKLSPAGEMAYRSLDLALQKAVRKQHNKAKAPVKKDDGD